MDELEFYKKQYAFLMGEIDHAIEELENHNYGHARHSLISALSVAEARWVNAFESEECDKCGLTLESFQAAL